MEMTSTRNVPRAGSDRVGGAQRSCGPQGLHSRLRDDRARRRKRLPDRAGGADRAGRGEIRGPDAACRHRSAATATRCRSTGRAAPPVSPRATRRYRSRRAENGAATALSYTVKAQVGGKIAQIGSRLVDGAAQKLADDFFARFSERGRGEEAAGAGAGASRACAAKRPWVRYVAIAILVARSSRICSCAGQG